MTREDRDRAKQVLERAVAAEVALDQATMAFDSARTALAAAKDEQLQASQAFQDWVKLNKHVPMVNGHMGVIEADGRVFLLPLVAVDTVAQAMPSNDVSPAPTPKMSAPAKPAKGK